MPVVIQACFSEDSFFCLAREHRFPPELSRTWQDPRWLLLLIKNRGGESAEMLS